MSSLSLKEYQRESLVAIGRFCDAVQSHAPLRGEANRLDADR